MFSSEKTVSPLYIGIGIITYTEVELDISSAFSEQSRSASFKL